MAVTRTLLAGGLAVAATLPAPALADQTRAGEIAEKLNDPMTQYAVAGMISAMTKAMLDMKVEPIAKAVEGVTGKPSRHLPPDATVADLAGTDQDEVREKLVRNVPQMMSAMGGMASAVEEMLPQLEEMAERMRDAVPNS